MERARFKRADYTQAETRQRHKKALDLGVDGARKTVRHQPNVARAVVSRQTTSNTGSSLLRTIPAAPVPIKSPEDKTMDDEKSTLSFNFELPTLRRPPDSGDISKHTVKKVLIICFGIIFFIIGYTSLWNIFHKPSPARVGAGNALKVVV